MSTGGSIRRKANPAKVTEEAERCFDLKAKGWSVRRIADEVGIAPSSEPFPVAGDRQVGDTPRAGR